VSTDSEKIAAVARDCGAEVPFLRPSELALDSTPSIDVMLHALEWLEAAREDVTALVLLQPTSPLRTHAHIDAAVELFVASRADTVVSVVELPHRFHPSLLVTDAGGWVAPYEGDSQLVKRRQDLPAVFARNGPAVLVVSPRVLRSGSLYGGRTKAYRMGAQESVDIDTQFDLQLADCLLNRRAESATLRA